jgi:single-strand DNA-binding protein
MRQGCFAGYVGKDAELTYTPTGTAVCKFSVAANRNKSKDGEDQKPLWVNCVIWAKRGESLAPHIKKGTFAVVGGELDIREYTDKSGANRWSLELNVQQFTFGGKNNSDSSASTSTQSTAKKPLDDEDVPF